MKELEILQNCKTAIKYLLVLLDQKQDYTMWLEIKKVQSDLIMLIDSKEKF